MTVSCLATVGRSAVLATARVEPGRLRYDRLRVRRDEDALMTGERWSSLDDLRARGASAPVLALSAQPGRERADAPVVGVLEPVARATATRLH